MNLYFKNDIGILYMGRGRDIQITDISGLALPKKIRNTASYAGVTGNVLLSETVGARTITISGDIKISDASDMLIAKMLRILDKAGTLYIQNGKKRCIQCSLSDIEFSKPSRVYREFVLQLTADYPYFTDNDYRKISMFSRIKNITSPFTLPRIFSKRVNEAVIHNNGDIRVFPIITISFSSDSQSDASVLIKNNTSDKSFSVIYSAKKDESITIDAQNRIILSNLSGDITRYISDSSYLSDLYLEPGENNLSILLTNCGNAFAECIYKNNYIENI